METGNHCCSWYSICADHTFNACSSMFQTLKTALLAYHDMLKNIIAESQGWGRSLGELFCRSCGNPELKCTLVINAPVG